MEREFDVEILTPAATLFSGKATEVVLPAYDGEVGVLAGHGDFVGVVGTGALKMVTDGDDYWFLLNKGVYQVRGGRLTVLTEMGEKPAKNVDIDELNARLKELEVQLGDLKNFSADNYPKLKNEYDQVKARIDIYRRTEVVN